MPSRTLARPMPREMRFAVVRPDRPQQPDTVIKGRCWVIDGDTIVIDNTHIRLAGIDAPELDHPWGQQSKWAMVKLCKGQTITARIKPEMSYDRIVAECFLPDGRDLAAELVKAGLALDWPKFSGGKYRHLEPADARRKLWRAHLRQRGLAPPAENSVPVASGGVNSPPGRLHTVGSGATAENVLRPWAYYRSGWLIAFGVLVLLVGCSITGRDAEPNVSASSGGTVSEFASFEVTASVLNVRRHPTGNSEVIAQIGKGTKVTPGQVSGNWYGIEMYDGSTGWVYRDFVGPAGQ